MRLELTEQDKAMLPVLALLVVVAAYVFLGIWPLHRANVHMRAQLETARKDLEEKQRKLEGLASVRAENEQLQKELQRIQESFYPMLESQDIGKLLTNMAREHGLTVRRLEIQMPFAAEWVPAFGSGQEREALSGGADSVFHAQVLLEVEGTKESGDRFLDALAYEADGIFTVTMRRLAARSMHVEDAAFFGIQEDEPLPLVNGAEAGDVLELKLDIAMCRKGP